MCDTHSTHVVSVEIKNVPRCMLMHPFNLHRVKLFNVLHVYSAVFTLCTYVHSVYPSGHSVYPSGHSVYPLVTLCTTLVTLCTTRSPYCVGHSLFTPFTTLSLY